MFSVCVNGLKLGFCSYYKYKLFLRKCKSDRDQDYVDALYVDLAEGDSNKFWRSYKYYNNTKRRVDVFVNNLRSNVDIANCFADSFEGIYESRDVAQSLKLENEFENMYFEYCNTHAADSLSEYYLSWNDIVNVLSTLKTGKATSLKKTLKRKMMMPI